MELRQLRYFVAIATRRSFRRAADDVRVAQPALSQQIRRLEAELGVELFDRGTRPVELTDAGQMLLPMARRILADVDRAAAEVREFSSEFRGRVVIGAMQYLTNLELPDLLAAFRERHPLVELQLRVGNTGQLTELLEAGEIDLAMCHADELSLPAHYAVSDLRTEELVILVAASNPLAAQRQVTVADFADSPFIVFRPGASIRAALENAFAEHGLTPRLTFESADIATAVELVKRDLGVALVPRSYAEREPATVRGVPVAPVRLTRRVVCVWRRDRYHSRAVDAFQDAAQRFIR